MSPQRFLRLFTEHVGLTPKRYFRVQRFQRAVHALRRKRGQRGSLTRLAVSCGYYDQAQGLSTRFRSLRIDVRHQIAVGDLVMNERLDTFTFHDGGWVVLPIAGVFELRGGKITAWRDYFDLSTFRRQVPGGPQSPARWGIDGSQ